MNKNHRIFNNIGLKLLALVISAGLWLMVTNFNDPLKYVHMTNIPVKLINTELITDKGMVYTMAQGADTIPMVTVGAPYSVAQQLTRDNIVAVANVEDITQLGTVPISLSTNIFGNQISSITGSIDSVKLAIENKKISSFTLKMTTSGEPANGYSVSEVIPEQNQVRVSGPESVVSTISSAAADVQVSGINSTINTYADIRLYDKDGNPVNMQNLTLNIVSVRVTVNVSETKTVPLQFSTSGMPAEGYMLNGTIIAEPAEVKIAGRASALSTIDALQIPGDVLNVSGLSEDITATLNVRRYLPDNVVFAEEGYTGDVKVVVGIDPVETKTVPIALSDITLYNIPEGYTAKLSEGEENRTVEVRLTGLQDVLEKITPESLDPAVNVDSSMIAAGKSTGNIQAALHVTLPEGISRTDSNKVQITISQE